MQPFISKQKKGNSLNNRKPLPSQETLASKLGPTSSSSLSLWKPPVGSGKETADKIAKRDFARLGPAAADSGGNSSSGSRRPRGRGDDDDQGSKPPPRRRRRKNDAVDESKFEWGKTNDNDDADGADDAGDGTAAAGGPVELPNFEVSGALLRDTNATEDGVVKTHVEPQDAQPPTDRWRCYVFKGDQQLDTLHLHRSSCYLFGRDRRVADVPLDHPSVSSQHAVIQYRQVTDKQTNKPTVKPYLMDLESTNGTKLNGQPVQAARYIELREQDVLSFGASTREFVLLHEKSGTTN